MKAEHLREAEARIRLLVSDAEQRSERLQQVRAELRVAEERSRKQAREAASAAEDQARKSLARQRKGIDANAEELRTTALSVARREVDAHSPAYLSADWTDAIWSDLPIAPAGDWLRVGTATFGATAVPLSLPLSVGVWLVASPNAEVFKGFVQNVIARAVAAFDAPRIRVTSYDPDLSLGLASFAQLRAISPTSVPQAITSLQALERVLEDLVSDVALLDDRLTAAGQRTYWTALSNGHPLALSTPLRLLVLASGPDHLSGRAIALLDQLRRLAPERGLLIIESASGAQPATHSPGTVITLGDKASASTTPNVSWTADVPAGDDFVRSLCAMLVDRPRQSLAPTVDFERIVDDMTDPWLVEVDEGLETVIGTVDGGDLVVRLRSEDPPMPNALIGGAVGQGKSNLLLVLIHSLAAQYSPAELEMVLVDLRDGVEFARLGPTEHSPTWLPHIRALGLEFDVDYSLAMLRWVRDQLPSRSRELQAHGATTLRDYRQKSGITMPRLLIVIDEFQRLFEGDDEEAAEAATLLEHIARTGRGFGVHIVLASQAITGIRGLATKADAIFGQFHNRIVLKTTTTESQAFLTAHNYAAAELEYRGQAVVNESLGASPANKLGTIAYAQPDYLGRLQAQLHRQGHGAPPSIFRATDYAHWPGSAATAQQTSGPRAAVGMRIAVEGAPRDIVLARAPNQAIAVVGTSRDIAIAVLTRAVTTAAQHFSGGARIVILDGDSDSSTSTSWVGDFTRYLEQQGHVIELVRRQKIAEKLNGLDADTLRPNLVVPVALDAVDLGSAVEPDFRIPSDALRELLKTGSLRNTWTIGWWQSRSVLEEHLGYRAPGIRAWAFAGVSRDDLTDIAGHGTRPPSASPRFVWFDRTGDAGAERLVPFLAEDLVGAVRHD